MYTDSEFLEPEAAAGADPSISRSGDPSATIDIEDMEEEEIGKPSLPVFVYQKIVDASSWSNMTAKQGRSALTLKSISSRRRGLQYIVQSKAS